MSKKKKALCIGVNNYPGTDMDLLGCVNDAQDWSAALGARGFQVTTLTDRQVTLRKMAAAMKDLIAGARKGDSLVITFSGHGTYAPDEDGDEADAFDEGLCGYDVKTKGPLLDDKIHEIFAARRKGVRLVLISDSCHSGTVTRAAPADPDVQGPRARFLPMAHWLPKSKLPAGVNGEPLRVVPAPKKASALQAALFDTADDLLLSGCKEGPNNFSYDAQIKGRYNGAFSHYALKALAALKPNATYAQWHKAIGDYLPSAQYPQMPQLVGSAAARARMVFD